MVSLASPHDPHANEALCGQLEERVSKYASKVVIYDIVAVGGSV